MQEKMLGKYTIYLRRPGHPVLLFLGWKMDLFLAAFGNAQQI